MIEYAVATPEDYPALTRLFHPEPYFAGRSWTLVGKKEGVIVCAIAQNPKYDQLVLGPVYVENAFQGIRMIEHLEKLLKEQGHSRYLFSIDKGLYPSYYAMMVRSKIPILISDEKMAWFRRDL